MNHPCSSKAQLNQPYPLPGSLDWAEENLYHVFILCLWERHGTVFWQWRWAGPHRAFVAADVGGRVTSPAFGVKGRLQKWALPAFIGCVLGTQTTIQAVLTGHWWARKAQPKMGKLVLFLGRGKWFCAQESVSCGEAWGKACGQTVQPSCPPLRTRPDGEDGHGSRQADDSDRTKTQRLSTFLFNL